MKFHGIRLVADDIHEDFAAGVVGMSHIQLRKRSGQVIAEDFVCGGDRTRFPCLLNPPGLIVDLRPGERPILRPCRGTLARWRQNPPRHSGPAATSASENR